MRPVRRPPRCGSSRTSSTPSGSGPARRENALPAPSSASTGKRVVMYAGNVGLLAVARPGARRRRRPGRRPRRRVRDQRRRRRPGPTSSGGPRGLDNVRFVDMQPKERLPEVLAAGRRPRGAAAARAWPGRACRRSSTRSWPPVGPIVASVDPGTEVARTVERAGAGLAVPPDDPEAFTKAIRRLLDDAGRGRGHGSGRAGRSSSAGRRRPRSPRRTSSCSTSSRPASRADRERAVSGASSVVGPMGKASSAKKVARAARAGGVHASSASGASSAFPLAIVGHRRRRRSRWSFVRPRRPTTTAVGRRRPSVRRPLARRLRRLRLRRLPAAPSADGHRGPHGHPHPRRRHHPHPPVHRRPSPASNATAARCSPTRSACSSSSDGFTMPDGTEYKNGYDCNGKPAEVTRVAVEQRRRADRRPEHAARRSLHEGLRQHPLRPTTAWPSPSRSSPRAPTSPGPQSLDTLNSLTDVDHHDGARHRRPHRLDHHRRAGATSSTVRGQTTATGGASRLDHHAPRRPRHREGGRPRRRVRHPPAAAHRAHPEADAADRRPADDRAGRRRPGRARRRRRRPVARLPARRVPRGLPRRHVRRRRAALRGRARAARHRRRHALRRPRRRHRRHASSWSTATC